MLPQTQSQKLTCPYCSERIEIVVDASVSEQSFIEDCQVCCRPIEFHVSILEDNCMEIHANTENDVW